MAALSLDFNSPIMFILTLYANFSWQDILGSISIRPLGHVWNAIIVWSRPWTIDIRFRCGIFSLDLESMCGDKLPVSSVEHLSIHSVPGCCVCQYIFFLRTWTTDANCDDVLVIHIQTKFSYLIDYFILL